MLSVIIPLHNESDRLDSCIYKLSTFLNSQIYKSEIILVENGSQDDTYTRALKWMARGVSPRVRVLSILARSKPQALAAGLEYAEGELIYLCDCDLSTPPSQINRFISQMKKYDLVIGSRRIDGAIVSQSIKRQMIGNIFSLITRTVVPNIKDTQCGFKMLRAGVARSLFTRLTITGLAYDVELLSLANRLGYKILELPVVWIEDKNSRVKIISDSWGMFRDVIKLCSQVRT